MLYILDFFAQIKRHLYSTLFFGIIYYIVNIYEVENKMVDIRTKKMIKNISFFECLYFSLNTETTVGYGEIIPQTVITRAVAMVQLILVLLIVVKR